MLKPCHGTTQGLNQPRQYHASIWHAQSRQAVKDNFYSPQKTARIIPITIITTKQCESAIAIIIALIEAQQWLN